MAADWLLQSRWSRPSVTCLKDAHPVWVLKLPSQSASPDGSLDFKQLTLDSLDFCLMNKQRILEYCDPWTPLAHGWLIETRIMPSGHLVYYITTPLAWAHHPDLVDVDTHRHTYKSLISDLSDFGVRGHCTIFGVGWHNSIWMIEGQKQIHK